MTIKAIVSYSCMVLSTLIIIVSLSTNYWYEYEQEDKEKPELVSRFRAGLFEVCETKIRYHLTDDEEHEDLGCDDYHPPAHVTDWTSRRDTLIATYILALIFTLIAFIFVTVYCYKDKYYFPVGRTAICFGLAAFVMLIGLAVYTNIFMNLQLAFSWSYGAGWSAIAMYIISIILLFADK